ncbi:MAG TPA: agmatine deiminase family protein [Pirellulales bacterium]|nr:agmatine deiminase family protein [Pirellulales bacterium]
MRPRDSFLLIVLGGVLTASAFFVGRWVQDYRGVESDSPSIAVNQAAVRPIPELRPSGRIPGAFEHHAALLLGINGLLDVDPEALVQIIEATRDRIKIIGVITSPKQEAQVAKLLESRGLPRSSVQFFQWPVESMWLRDYAPYFMVGGHTTLIDFTYARPERDMADSFPPVLAASMNFHYTHCGLTFEGGDLIVNGDGLCITTPAFVTANTPRGMDLDRIGEILHDQFHFKRWVRLNPLDDEPTGHTSLFVTLCAQNKAILGISTQNEDSVNAQILDGDAALLSAESTTSGPLEVVRIPMPSHADGIWRSYTSAIYVNGVVLVPQYPDQDAKLDKIALDVYRNAMPGWKPIGIDCSKLVSGGGGLHRISRAIPQLPAP